jgi:hypothetical protein
VWTAVGCLDEMLLNDECRCADINCCAFCSLRMSCVPHWTKTPTTSCLRCFKRGTSNKATLW